MCVLKNIEPLRVMYYFEEISKIPRGSGNIDEISEYLVDFAKAHSLRYIQDEIKNVIIFKDASEGYENRSPVIIQGHMDMVAVKTSNCNKDMKTEGLDLFIDGDLVGAKDTTLGADNGVAVAYALALLESSEYKHPKLEVIITVEEEVGMDGAKYIDVSMLEGRKFINIDSGEEGYLLTSCAGGGRFLAELDLAKEMVNGSMMEITLDGLQGGHSGVEIHTGRANACYEIIRLVRSLADKLDVKLASACGGGVDNVIPSLAKVTIIIDEKDEAKLNHIIECHKKMLQNEYIGKEEGININIRNLGVVRAEAISDESFNKMSTLILALPNGVQSMSGTISGLVETSLNLGVMNISADRMNILYAVRSSVESKKEELVSKMNLLAKAFNAKVVTKSFYPAWQYREKSQLREEFIRAYKELFGKEPVIEAVHAGLECGFFAGKIENLDCISFGPDLYEIHSVNERMSISSLQRMWKYLLRVLETAE